MKQNQNISSPKSGMNRETHVSQLKNIDFTFMLNGNTESQVGEGVNIVNEPSNNLAVIFPVGYKVIHYKKDLLNNKTYYFLTNPETKKSSIGYVEDTLIESYNTDTYQECTDCSHNSNILGVPLEDTVQVPSHTYIEIINDICQPVGEGFNFNINYPIKFSELKQEKGVTNIYWNDKLNKPRWICLSDVSYLFLQEQECGDPIVLDCLQVHKLLQFPEHARIQIDPQSQQIGGTLKMGAYEFYAAYSNLYGEEATNYSTPTNPISIFDENNNILNDETTDAFTNYSIRLKVTNLDTRFKYYKVVCVETNNVTRSKSGFIVGIYPTTDDTILYTSSGSTNDDYIVTGNSSIKRRIDLYELSRVRPEYEFAAGDVESAGRKFMWGLKTKSEVNLQPVVNLFGSLLKWQSNIARESLYKTPIATAKYKGWMRNEVQPFAIRFSYKDGGYSANFPLIGRPATSFDIETVDSQDINFKSIIENNPSCFGGDRTKRWQIFNTATQDSICETLEEDSVIITEDVEKICLIPEALELASDSIEIPIVVGFNYSGLEDYIENNLDYITTLDPENPDIYNNLGQYLLPENVPGSCSSDINFDPTRCTSPVLDREEIFVNTIEGENNVYTERDIEDYRKTVPSMFCNVYKLSQVDGNVIEDTDFQNSYMSCGKKVYFRSNIFQNEDCSYATNIVDNNTPSQPGMGYYNNYFGATTLAGLEHTYTTGKKAATPSAEFRPFLHEGALFFRIPKVGRDKLIFELTKNSISTTNDDNDAISDNTTPQKLRYTFYSGCSSTSPLLASVIADSTIGSIIELDVTTFPTIFYVAVDAPYVSESVPIVPGECPPISGVTTTYRTAPPTGCFSLYTRNIEYLSVVASWSNLVLDKKQTYVASCDFIIPKVEECVPIPYARGKFAYWESIETYPQNKELYDSSSLKITPTDLQELSVEDKQLFKDYFVDSDLGGIYTLKGSTDFTCDSPIRHPKFPDNNITPFMAAIEVADNTDALIFPLGIYLDPAVVRAMLQVAVNNNLITPKQLSSIEGYEILKGDNSIHKSVIANGLGYDMYKYEQKGKDYFYANYPHNDLGEDMLHYVSSDNKTLIQHPFKSNLGNNKFSFLSPDLFLNRITIPTEAVLSGYQVGTSTTTFQDVEDHPKWTLLGDKARSTANTLALTESILEFVIAETNFITQSGLGNTWILVGVSSGTNAPGGIISTIAIAAFTVAKIAAEAMSYGKYRYEWLKIFDELGTAYNFASYGVSHGYHNKFIKNSSEDNYLRALPLRKYMRDGRYTYRDESSGEDIAVNNFQREHSIFLSTGKEEFNFNYSSEYSSHDNNILTDKSSRTRLGLNNCASEEEIRGSVGSPYISLKNYVPDQFGILDSVKWLTIGYQEKIERIDNCNIMILGGNVCISRFTWKRKLPIFKKNIVGTADRIPFNYGDYKNIGSPVYYCNYKSDSTENILGVPFPDINSDLNFDSCGSYKNAFYIRPPAKMYLSYYGITDFLVESEINCNFRYAQNSYKEFFYPQAGDAVDWTQEKNVPIKEPNRFFYNNTYSQQVSNTPYRTLDRGYSKEEWERRTIQDNAVIYSELDNSENDISDPWLIYKPLNWYEFPSKYGKLIQLKGVESEELLGRFENQLVGFNTLDKIQSDNGRVSIELGNAGIFAQRPYEYLTTDLGTSGTQHSDMVNTPYGNFFVDAKRGQVFQRAGKDLSAISDKIGQQSSGLKNWFREQLPFKLLKKFPEADIDNKYKSIGISMGWDARMDRVFLTKKDYIPVNDPCLKYDKDIGFYTDCEGSDISCPIGYSYNEESLLCEKIVVSDPICPDGYTYNEILQQCILTTVEPADCEEQEFRLFPISMTNISSLQIGITSGQMSVDWGDGNIDNFLTPGMHVLNHTYSSPFTGEIVITVDNLDYITSINGGSGIGTYVEVKTSELQKLINLDRISLVNNKSFLSGIITELPANLTYTLAALTNLSGNIADMPPISNVFTILGSNTLTGNINDIVVSTENFEVAGNNTITGNLNTLKPTLESFSLRGNNTVVGNISDIPAIMTSFILLGNSTITGYVSGRVWETGMVELQSTPTVGGLTSSQVDNLLIDLAAATWVSIPNLIRLTGTNQPRTTASDSAVIILQGSLDNTIPPTGKKVKVFTN